MGALFQVATGNRSEFRHDYSGTKNTYAPQSNMLLSTDPFSDWKDSWGSTDYSWDHRGNMTGMRHFASKERTQLESRDTLVFNSLGQMVAYAKVPTQGAGYGMRFGYDENGWKVQEQQHQGDLNGAVTDAREYFVQGVHVLAERTVGDSLWSHPIPLGNAKVAIVDEKPGDKVEVHWLHNDHLGSAAMATDSNGRVVMRAALDPYGNVEDISGTWKTKYLFTGKEYVATTGMYYFGARWYSPDLGMWISRDAVKTEFSSYLFSGSNPLFYFDPNGLEKYQIVIFISGSEITGASAAGKNGEYLGTPNAVVVQKVVAAFENSGLSKDFAFKITSDKKELLAFVNQGDYTAIVSHGADNEGPFGDAISPKPHVPVGETVTWVDYSTLEGTKAKAIHIEACNSGGRDVRYSKITTNPKLKLNKQKGQTGKTDIPNAMAAAGEFIMKMFNLEQSGVKNEPGK
jgi:RHS repeat-associated protein